MASLDAACQAQSTELEKFPKKKLSLRKLAQLCIEGKGKATCSSSYILEKKSTLNVNIAKKMITWFEPDWSVTLVVIDFSQMY